MKTMNKVILSFFFIFVSILGSAQSSKLIDEAVWTNEGFIYIVVFYEGTSKGQEIAKNFSQTLNPVHSLSRGQLQAIDNVLQRFTNRTGDTFRIGLASQTIDRGVAVEMTSATEWIYWAFAPRD